MKARRGVRRGGAQRRGGSKGEEGRRFSRTRMMLMFSSEPLSIASSHSIEQTALHAVVSMRLGHCERGEQKERRGGEVSWRWKKQKEREVETGQVVKGRGRW
eukprot:764540-Hanusia_phi.AAC.1